MNFLKIITKLPSALLVLRAIRADNKGNYERALLLLDRVEWKEGSPPEYTALKAKLMILVRRYEDAEALFKSIAGPTATGTPAHHYVSLYAAMSVAMMDSDLAEAHALFAKMQSIERPSFIDLILPASVSPWRSQAKALLRSAGTDTSDPFGLLEESAGVYWTMALSDYSHGKLEASLRQIATAESLRPLTDPQKALKGTVLMHLNRRPEADRLFTDVVENSSPAIGPDVEYAHLYCTLYRESDPPPDSERLWSRAQQLERVAGIRHYLSLGEHPSMTDPTDADAVVRHVQALKANYTIRWVHGRAT